jgi:ATP-dependent protease ClpP protease subunit
MATPIAAQASATSDEGPLRILHLEGSINESVTVRLVKEIEKANRDGSIKAVLLEINSPGGLIDEGILISKAIERSKTPVHCLVDGEADSMAFYVLQSCKTRMMTKRSMLMLHGPSISTDQFSGQFGDWYNYAVRLKVLQRAIIEHMCSRMNITADQMEERIKDGKEWWMNWQEAKDVKAIDIVVQDFNEAKSLLK